MAAEIVCTLNPLHNSLRGLYVLPNIISIIAPLCIHGIFYHSLSNGLCRADHRDNPTLILGIINCDVLCGYKTASVELHITIKITKYAEDAVDFAVYLVKACVIGGELGVSNVEFSNVIEALDKVMAFSYKFQFGFVQLCWNWDV
jgi:hypothetical protein